MSGSEGSWSSSTPPGIRPGARLVLCERNSDETLTLEVNGKRVPLGRSAAGKVWVSAG